MNTPFLNGEAESLRLLLETCGEGVAVILCDGELAYANETFLAMMDMPPDEIPVRMERFLNGEPTAVTTEVMSKEGVIGPAEMRKVVSSWCGEKAVLVFIREVSGSPALYQKAIKERKEEAIEVMAGGIAHDLNNFSAIILGNLSLAKMGLDQASELATLLKDVEAGARRAKDFATLLVMLSKAPIQYKATVLIEKALSGAAAMAFAGAKTTLDASYAEAGLMVQADEEALTKAFANLFSFSRQAMGGEGVVRATVSKLLPAFKEGEAKGMVEIRLQDHGAGFPPGSIHKLFDPYFIPKQKEFPRGGKLDLAFAAAVIKKHGGQISAASELEKGTTFVIHLPI